MASSSLQESFHVLRNHFLGSNHGNDAANTAHLVLFAENAAKEGYCSLAVESLDLYFSLNPPTNQFLIRAHLCRALTTAAPPTPEPEERLQRAMDSIVTAVDIARKSECYHFLVHNASVLLWQICRPHRSRPGWMGLCVGGWQSVARAQETCLKEDPAWRLDVLLALLQSQVEAGLREEAGKTSLSALQLARKRLPERLLDTLKLCASYGLGEGKGVEKETKSVPESSTILKLYKLKQSLSLGSGKQSEVESELRKLVEAVTNNKIPVRKTPAPSKTPPQTSSPESKAAILLEIAQVCVEQGLVELGRESVAALPGEAVGPRLDLLRHTVIAQLYLLRSGAGLPLYSRRAVEAREQTIAQLENCLTAAQRLGDQELVQHVGVVLWGVCLPLLQPNLLPHLSHVLSVLASALEQVDSVFHGLRCMVHMELAKLCADQDQLQTALEHVKKAQELDRECEWSEQLRWLGERLQLRSELYLTPSSTLLQATQLLEQVKSSGGCGSKEEMRAVLVKVGALLAPHHFPVAIGDRPAEPPQSQTEATAGEEEEGEKDGEREEGGREGRSGGGVSGVQSESGDSEYPGVVEVGEEGKEKREETDKEGEKVYELLKEQVQAHSEEVGTTEDADRCRLWADLTKFARKREVWDVAFVSAKFCLIYDDKRWTAAVAPVKTQPSKTGSKMKLQKSSSVSVNRSRSDVSARSSSLTVASLSTSGPASEREAGRKRGRERLCRELLRTLAETHCVHAECAVYRLKESGHQLGDGLPPPTPTDQQSTESNVNLGVWPGSLSSDAYSSFLRAGELGCSVSEAWLVTNAATYLCNHSRHLLEAGTPSRLVPVFRPLLASMTAGNQQQTETIGEELVCRVSAVLAGGLVQKWTPSPPDPSPDPSRETLGARKSGRGTAMGKKKGGGGESQQLQVSPEGGPELQEALSVCERALGVGGDLPLGVRAPLLATWVRCRQLLQQPIPSRTLGVEEKDGESCVVGCRAVVMVEMLSLLGNRIWDFPDCPTLADAFELVGSCVWSGDDLLLELELLTRIARLALLQKNYSLVSSCKNKAVESILGPAGEGKLGQEEKKRKKRKGKIDARHERELLSCICSLHGQALVAEGAGKAASTRATLEAFLQSAKYGREAGSYQWTMEAGRLYWNVCRELTKTRLDRQTVRRPLTDLLSILTSFLPPRSSVRQGEVCEEDLQLYVDIYRVLFQIYVDKGEWAEGMKAVEEAMWVTPMSIHQGLAEYKLVFRSQMGKDVAADMIRFQEASDGERARLWFKVACNSSCPRLQLSALQTAINTLTSPSHVWVKVDYLLVLSEWLYEHQFPVEEVLSHLQWTLTLLLDQGGEERQEEGEREEEGGGKEERSRSECGVCTWEKVVQILVRMARLQSRGGDGHRESCLAALAHCCLIWKATLESFSQSVPGKSNATLPSSVQEWVDFTPTDELRDFVRSADTDSSVSPRGIRTPGLTCHYLGALSDELCAGELHGLALPVETLRQLVVDCLMQSGATSQLIHLRLTSMCAVLGAQRASEEHRQLAGPVYLNPQDVARSRVEMNRYQQQREAGKREESRTGAFHATLPLSPAPSHDPTEGPVLRRVWAEEAALLAKQGQFEVARELLQEAQLSCQVFGDRETMGGLLLTQAFLAAAEKSDNECINCIIEAQRYLLSLEQWEEGLQLLLSLADSQQQSLSLRETAVTAVGGALSSLCSDLQKRNSNERRRVEIVQATLQARLVVVKARTMLAANEKNTEALERVCQEMSASARGLVQLGRREEAAQVMLDHARITMRCLMIGFSDAVTHKASLLKAVELMKGAVDTLQSVLRDTLSLCPLPDGLCVTEEGMLVEAGLELADALLRVSERHVEEERQERKTQQQKTCVEQMIGDYIRVSPEHGSVEDVWNRVASSAAERVLAVLTPVLTCGTVQSQARLKARCGYGVGRALLLMAQQSSPDSPSPWRQSGEVGEGVAQTVDGGEEDGGVGGGESVAVDESLTRENEASKTETVESEALRYVDRGSQLLREALDLALQCRDMEFAAMVARVIADSCGNCEPKTAALHLAVYQSCVASQHLLQLLRQVQPDPSQSRLAALLHQHSELSYASPSSPPLPPPQLLEAVTDHLNSYTCWQRLGVSTDYLDLLRYFPSHFRFIILQHTEDTSQLYSAYLVPPQPQPPAAKKGQPPPVTVSEVPVVAHVGVSPGDRERLVSLMDSCRKLQAQQLLKSPPLERAMSQEFSSIRDAMDGYLSPALESISVALQEEKIDEGLTLVLLADCDLLQLPLEALTLLQSDCVKAVSRDFSLQMHYHRIKKFVVEDEAASTKKKDKFQPQPSFLQANTTNFKYILDPRCDLTNHASEEHPSSKIVCQVNAFPKITSKWTGHKGTTAEESMSSSQWHPILEQCSGLLFLGSERLLAHFPAGQLISLSLQDCSVAVVMDHIQTLKSSLTQSKLDLHKSRRELEVEERVQTAALLSLAGVSCLLSRQWYSTVDACTDTMCSCLKRLLSEGVGVAGMKWREIRELHQLNTDSDIQQLPTEPSQELKDHSSAFNSVVYGLPHLALYLPTT